MLNWIRTLALAATTSFLAACGGGDDGHPSTTLAVAQSDPQFSILVEAVQAAGLGDTLSGPGPLTVFAPTNAAFAALLTELGISKDALLANKPLLTAVLTSGQYGEYKRDRAEDDTSYMIGAAWALGKHVILASYQNAEQGSNDCDMYSLGYRYDFSKRTFFITSYTKVDNSGTMNCNFGTAGLGAAGQDPQGFMFGVRHLF